MKQYIDDFLILIRDLANQHIPNSAKSLDEAMSKVRDYTKLMWNGQNKEIISKLEEFNVMFQKDYQLFWFDCLKYPFNWPEMKSLDGIPLDMKYEYLPSDFNYEYFHDSIIKSIIFDDNLELGIDKVDILKEENSVVYTGRKAKVIFNNVSNIEKQEWIEEDRKYIKTNFEAEDLIEVVITDFVEVPAINYCLTELDLKDNPNVKEKRIFVLGVFLKRWTRIIIACDSWKIEKYEK